MRNRSSRIALVALAALVTVSSVWGNGIARFNDPALHVPPPWMFYAYRGAYDLFIGWSGPPAIQLDTPLGSVAGCTMVGGAFYMSPTGVVPGGPLVFYDANQVEVFRVTFTNGLVDYNGLRCGPSTGGTVQFTWSPNGVQLPPGLTEPLQGAWFSFEFHNMVQGPRGPQWTASFTCGATGLRGDLNCDGVVNFADIDPFVLALGDPAGYSAAYPWCAIENADINTDGQVNFADIDPFVALLSG